MCCESSRSLETEYLETGSTTQPDEYNSTCNVDVFQVMRKGRINLNPKQ